MSRWIFFKGCCFLSLLVFGSLAAQAQPQSLYAPGLSCALNGSEGPESLLVGGSDEDCPKDFGLSGPAQSYMEEYFGEASFSLAFPAPLFLSFEQPLQSRGADLCGFQQARQQELPSVSILPLGADSERWARDYTEVFFAQDTMDAEMTLTLKAFEDHSRFVFSLLKEDPYGRLQWERNLEAELLVNSSSEVLEVSFADFLETGPASIQNYLLRIPSDGIEGDGAFYIQVKAYPELMMSESGTTSVWTSCARMKPVFETGSFVIPSNINDFVQHFSLLLGTNTGNSVGSGGPGAESESEGVQTTDSTSYGIENTGQTSASPLMSSGSSSGCQAAQLGSVNASPLSFVLMFILSLFCLWSSRLLIKGRPED